MVAVIDIQFGIEGRLCPILHCKQCPWGRPGPLIDNLTDPQSRVGLQSSASGDLNIPLC